MMATEEKGQGFPTMIRLIVVDIDGVVSPGEAAPANTHPSVKQLAHYTSPYEDGSGLVDILTRLEAH